MVEHLFRGDFELKPTAALQQVICERCHNFLDILGCRVLGMGHGMPVDVGGDARLRVPCPALHRVDRCADVQEQGERGMAQVIEADVWQVCLSQDVFELAGDLGLVNEGS